MPRRHGCLKTSITVDVQGCTNALKDRMSEKGRPEHRRSLPSMAIRHCLQDAGTYDLSGTKIMTVRPEHKKQPVGCFYLHSSNMLNAHEYYLNSGYASIPQSDLSIPSYSSSSVTRIPITFLSTNHTTKLAVNTHTNIVAAPIN